MKFEQINEIKEFNQLYKELDEMYHILALNAGLSDSAFLILYTIMESGGGCLQKDIAAMYSISKQTINSSIKNLEKQGYLESRPGKGHDKHLFLTAAGQAFADERIIPVMQLDNDVFREMPPEEISEFLRLTRKYVAIYREKFNHLLNGGNES